MRGRERRALLQRRCSEVFEVLVEFGASVGKGKELSCLDADFSPTILTTIRSPTVSSYCSSGTTELMALKILLEVDELVRKHLPLLNCKLGRVVVDDGVEGSLAHLQTYAMARW